MKPILLIITLLFTSLSLQAQNLKLGLPVGHESVVRCAFFSEDGNYVLTGSADSKAAIWDIETGKVIQKFEGHKGCVHDLKFDKEKNQFHSASCDSTIKVWDVNSGAILKDFKYNGQNQDFEFDDEHRYQLFRYDSFTWALMDLDFDKIKYKITFSSMEAPPLSPSRKYLILHYADSVCIRNFKTGELFKKIKKKKANIVFNKDESHFVLKTKKRLSIYNRDSESPSKVCEDNSLTKNSFSPSGGEFLSTIDKKVSIWNTITMSLINEFTVSESEIYETAFITDRRIFIVCKNGTALLYDLDRNEFIWSQKDYLLQFLRSPRMQALKESYDKWTGFDKWFDKNWFKEFGKRGSEINFNSFYWSTYSLIPESVGHQFFTYSRHGIKSWSTDTGDPMYLIREKSNFICSEKLDLILSYYTDSNIVNIWDLQTGQLNRQLSSRTKKNNTLRILQSNQHADVILSAFGSNQLRQISLKDGQLIKQYYPHRTTIEDIAIKNSIIFTRSRFEVNLNNVDKKIPFFRKEYPWEIQNAGINDSLIWIAGSNHSTWADDNERLLWTARNNHSRWAGDSTEKWDTQFFTKKRSIHNRVIPSFARRLGKRSYMRFMETPFEVSDYQLNILGGNYKGYVVMPSRLGFLSYSQQKVYHTAKRTKYNDFILTIQEYVPGVGNNIEIWKKNTYNFWESKISLDGHTSYINDARFIGKYNVLSTSADKTVRYWFIKKNLIRSRNAKKIFQSPSFPIDADISENLKYVISSCADGSIFIWDFESEEPLIQMYMFDNDPEKWLHLHPSGLFDASPEAMDLMYWTKGLEVIEFSQLKDRYWLPGLWEKVISGKELPKVKNMQELKLYPEVTVNTIDENTLLVDLIKRNGGYGAVKVLLNGKEINQDARGVNFDPTKEHQSLKIDIKDHPYLKEGENKITVIAASENGIDSRGVEQTIYIDPFEAELPNFYAVVIGVGEYANDRLNLKYATKDAEGIAKALKLGADGLFPNRNSIYALTSNSKLKPSKTNIEKVFNEISKTAKSQDVILLYMAGHGISTSSESGEFYFLTKDAISTSKEAYLDEQIREANTISTNEWVEWLKKIPALKQVMIIDACGSGKAVENLVAMRDIDPSQIRAIDRMKDRTGMYIISGCAADAVSYEASQYGQGLLTFSILEGMKGAALKEGQFIDVENLLNHARESVPVLAEGIGGIQTPQLLKPKSGSFDIGILSEDSKSAIPLANPKTVFVRSSFVNSETFEDDLQLSQLLDERLILRSARGSHSDLVYFDVRNFPNACKLSGGYTKSGEQIALTLNIRCGDDLVTHTFTASTVDELCNKVIVLVRKSISSNK